MTSVDTGWITDENPAPKRENLRNQGFVPPLDVIDGAARVLDPVVEGIHQPQTPIFGDSQGLQDQPMVNKEQNITESVCSSGRAIACLLAV